MSCTQGSPGNVELQVRGTTVFCYNAGKVLTYRSEGHLGHLSLSIENAQLLTEVSRKRQWPDFLLALYSASVIWPRVKAILELKNTQPRKDKAEDNPAPNDNKDKGIGQFAHPEQ